MTEHTCRPDSWCVLCDLNERDGGTRNHPDAPKRPSPSRKPTAARGRCLHIGRRTEFRPGCGGRMCRHTCEAGEPVAVPGGVCQTCPRWEPDG